MNYDTSKIVVHKCCRKWLGVEMAEHFCTVVLPRMKKVLAYDNSGISKELKTPRQASSATPLKEGNNTPSGDADTPLKEGDIEQLFEKSHLILPIESLFVFGTNAENLKEIIATLKAEKQDKNLGEAFILNPEAQKHTLLVQIYKTAERIFAKEKDPQRY